MRNRCTILGPSALITAEASWGGGTVEVVDGTDWPLVIATFAGPLLGALAVIVAAYFAGIFSARQDTAQYREGLNKQRREVYPTLLRWADDAERAVGSIKEGPGPVENAILWCCASPDLLHALKELDAAWGTSFSAAPMQSGASTEEMRQKKPDEYKTALRDTIEKVRLQARWDLFGEDGFTYRDLQEYKSSKKHSRWKRKPRKKDTRIGSYEIDTHQSLALAGSVSAKRRCRVKRQRS